MCLSKTRTQSLCHITTLEYWTSFSVGYCWERLYHHTVSSRHKIGTGNLVFLSGQSKCKRESVRMFVAWSFALNSQNISFFNQKIYFLKIKWAIFEAWINNGPWTWFFDQNIGWKYRGWESFYTMVDKSTSLLCLFLSHFR